MLRKLMLVAVAAAAPIGLIAIAGTAGAAKSPPINATTNTVTCTSLKGTVTFSPTVTSSESAGPDTSALDVSFSKCTSNAAGLTVTSGKATGTLNGSRTAGENGCVSLAGGSTDTGTVSVAWKTKPALSSGDSVLSVNSVAGGVASDGHGYFSIPGSVASGTPSGSFQGTDSGSGDQSTAQTTDTAAKLLSTCDKSGLTKIDIETEPGATALNLS
jgi:hypothetical protein